MLMFREKNKIKLRRHIEDNKKKKNQNDGKKM